jgi:hypothetical protein
MSEQQKTFSDDIYKWHHLMLDYPFLLCKTKILDQVNEILRIFFRDAPITNGILFDKSP